MADLKKVAKELADAIRAERKRQFQKAKKERKSQS